MPEHVDGQGRLTGKERGHPLCLIAGNLLKGEQEAGIASDSLHHPLPGEKIPVPRGSGLVQIRCTMRDGDPGHANNVASDAPVLVEDTKVVEEVSKARQADPVMPGWIVQAAKKEQIVNLLRIKLHWGGGQKPQSPKKPLRSQILQ